MLLEWGLSNTHQFHGLGIAVYINRVVAGDVQSDGNELPDLKIRFGLTHSIGLTGNGQFDIDAFVKAALEHNPGRVIGRAIEYLKGWIVG